MGAFKKGVFMYPNGMVSITIGDSKYIQLGREDAKELADMILNVVDAPDVGEQQAQVRMMPSKDGSRVWFYSADKTVDEEIFDQLFEKEMAKPVIERREDD